MNIDQLRRGLFVALIGASCGAWAGPTSDDPASAESTAAEASAADRMRALAATSDTSPVVGSPASLDLTLWNFIANIRAQQSGNGFQRVMTSSANIDYTLNAVPAPVPLPTPAGLLLAGLAGLGALRLRARAGRRGAGLSLS